MRTEPHTIEAEDPETGRRLGYPAAYVHAASPDAVRTVLDAPEGTPDGRSEYVWLRLANGDLILGVFPRGDTYLGVEEDAQYPLPLKSKVTQKVEMLLDKLEVVRNWLHEVEADAPITEINEAIDLIWSIHGTPSEGG